MTETKQYTWVELAGGLLRAKCTPCAKVMKWALEIRPEYGKTISKHTNRERFQHRVVFNGRIVQVWKCPDCKESVVK